MRLKIVQEADKKEILIILLCKKHHVSRKWFYKWKLGIPVSTISLRKDA